MTLRHVFKMGMDIPAWLLSADPVQAHAPRGNFRFACDCDVIETDDYFLVVPLQTGPYPIDTSNMVAHNVYATSKNVVLVLAQGGFGTLEHAQWTGVLPGLPGAGGPATSVEVKDPHPSFWDRLRYVLKGY